MNIKNTYADNGFAIIGDVFTRDEVSAILTHIQSADHNLPTFRHTANLFAIRQLLKQLPQITDLVFNGKLSRLLMSVFGEGYFVAKSIYFDKPASSNWFVAYHQDLTISVDKKLLIPGYGPWTVKQEQYAVQPPLDILNENYTVRIHLDAADTGNGALKVIPGSHRKGVYRTDNIDRDAEEEIFCEVTAGGVMLMSPLLLHASARTTNGKQRRVIHIEFARSDLPGGLNWSEKIIDPFVKTPPSVG